MRADGGRPPPGQGDPGIPVVPEEGVAEGDQAHGGAGREAGTGSAVQQALQLHHRDVPAGEAEGEAVAGLIEGR